MRSPVYSITDGVTVNRPLDEICRSEEFHFHSHWEIYVLSEGRVLSLCNGESVTVNAPCIIIHKPFSLHRLFFDKEVCSGAVEPVGFCLDFSEGYIGRYLMPDILPCSMFGKVPHVISATDKSFEEIYALCRLIGNTRGADDNGKERMKLLTSAMLRVFADCIASGIMPVSDDTHKAPERFGYIYDILKHISLDPGMKNPVDKLAKRYYISPAKLRCDFKLIAGDTLGDYIDNIKLLHAMMLLEKGNSVNLTAELCGYANHNSFIRFFKEKTGTTPARYARYE